MFPTLRRICAGIRRYIRGEERKLSAVSMKRRKWITMANEKRLIDVDARIAEIRKTYCSDASCDNYHGIKCRVCWVDDGISLFEDAPTVDAVEVVHGRWVLQRYYGGMRKGMVARVICSECGYPNEETNYCPNCGAKMR